MKSKSLNNTYTITLPGTTSIDVIDWFEYMEEKNILVEKITELVKSEIKSGYKKEDNTFNKVLTIDMENVNNIKAKSEDNFINNIYNWQESNHAIFKDENQERPKIKGMLSV